MTGAQSLSSGTVAKTTPSAGDHNGMLSGSVSGAPHPEGGNQLPRRGPSSLPRWLPCSQQRSGGVRPPRPPLAHPRRRPRRHPRRPPPPAPVLVTRRALAFPLNLR